MSQREEKQIFEWLDQLDLDQAQEVGKHVEVSDVDPLDQETLIRLKAKTFAKLGDLKPGNKAETTNPESVKIKWISANKKLAFTLAASMLALVLFSFLAVASPEVRAQVRKVLQFLPGFASVQESGEELVRYVLPSTVTQQVGEEHLEVRGVSIGDKQSFIAITGTGNPPLKSIELVNNSGDRYLFQSGSIASSGDWTGSYYYKGRIHVTNNMELVADKAGVRIPFKLVPASHVDRIEELGPTSVSQGISLTAVTAPAGENKTKVTLIPQLPTGLRFKTVGLRDFDDMEKPKLIRGSGEEAVIYQDDTFPNPKESYFQGTAAEVGGYKLTISSIAVAKQADQPEKFSVPIPSEGIQMLNKQVNILGFPVDLIKVERIHKNSSVIESDQIRIYLDMNYKETAPQSMLYFTLDTKNGGYGFKTNDLTKAMEYIDLPIQPEDKNEYTNFIKEGHVLIRGPWEIELK